MNGCVAIDGGRLLDVFAAEAGTLAEVVNETRSDLPIPGCPGLTVGETARHVGSVYRMVLAWVRAGQRPESWPREPESGRLATWVRDGARALVDELAIHDPDEPCSTWRENDQTYGFWHRRMAHETTIHRSDVQAAAGLTTERIQEQISDGVAADGVDEVLGLWFTHRLRQLGVSGTRECSVAVRTADQVWLTRIGVRGTAAWQAHPDEAGRADAEVSGPPATVYRWLWGRLPDQSVSREGDFDAVAQLWALLRLATR